MRRIILTVVMATISVVFGSVAQAAIVATPRPGSGTPPEIIDISGSLPSLESFDGFFPNEFDRDHHKVFTFDAVVTPTGNPGLNAAFIVVFDWRNLDGSIGASPLFETEFVPAGPITVRARFELDFCPEQVSLHLNNISDSAVEVNGVFTHDCLNTPTVPVPAAAWGGIALMGMVGVRKLVRRHKNGADRA